MSRTIGGHEVRNGTAWKHQQDLELKQGMSGRTALTGETGKTDTDPAESE